jgi:glycosyltransferase involved in cell wall biosynthesis
VRIAFVITRGDSVGGAQVHVRDLAAALLRAGHDVKVFIGGSGPAAEALANLGVPHHCLEHLVHPIRPHRDVRGFFELRRELKAFGPDLISTHSSKAGLLGRAAARSLGIPAIFTAHGFAFTEGVGEKKRKLYTLVEWIGAKLANRIISVSDYDRNLALKRGVTVPEKIRTIHNAMPDVGLQLRADPARHPPRIVMVARFEPPKDHAALLRALAPLKNLPWTLDFVGGGSLLEPARKLATELGIGYRVEFAGDTRHVAERLARAQLFALVTQYEGLPRSIIEAMRAGLPVVASNVGGVREEVIDDVTGFLVRRGDEATLQEKIELLLKDAELRRRMGESGRKRYEEHFTFDRVFRETTAVYDEVLGRGPAVPEKVETRSAA